MNEQEIARLLNLQTKPTGWNKFIDKWLAVGYEPDYRIEFKDGVKYTIFSDDSYARIEELGKDCLYRSVWFYQTEKGTVSIREHDWLLQTKSQREEKALAREKANFDAKYLTLADICAKTGIWQYLGIQEIEEKQIRIFWTMLITQYPDQWRMALNGDIYIDDELCNALEESYGKSATWFLEKEFTAQGKTGRHQFIRGQVQVDNEERGVYGIYYEGKCIYVGLCLQKFAEERKIHQEIAKGLRHVPAGMEFYKSVADRSKVEFRVLFNAAKAQTKKLLSLEHLETIQLALITIMQPVGNLQGRVTDYVFKSEFGREN